MPAVAAVLGVRARRRRRAQRRRSRSPSSALYVAVTVAATLIIERGLIREVIGYLRRERRRPPGRGARARCPRPVTVRRDRRSASIIPARDAEATIGRTLAALAAQASTPFEVIVVDDGSGDATAAIVERRPGRSGSSASAPGGPGRGAQPGVGERAAPLLAFTDADCFPAPDWLREGLAALERADLVQGAVRPIRRGPATLRSHRLGRPRVGPLRDREPVLHAATPSSALGGFEDWLGARLGKQLPRTSGWAGGSVAGSADEFCEQAWSNMRSSHVAPGEYIAERLRLAYFPAIVAKVPELRGVPASPAVPELPHGGPGRRHRRDTAGVGAHRLRARAVCPAAARRLDPVRGDGMSLGAAVGLAARRPRAGGRMRGRRGWCGGAGAREHPLAEPGAVGIRAWLRSRS